MALHSAIMDYEDVGIRLRRRFGTRLGQGLRFPFKVGLSAVLAVAVTVAGSDKPRKLHPERGRIISMRTELHTRGKGVYSDSDGGVHGGQIRTNRVPIYLLHTEQMDYEIEGKNLTVGSEVTFRIEKGKLYIESGAKEVKYNVVGQRVGGEASPIK